MADIVALAVKLSRLEVREPRSLKDNVLAQDWDRPTRKIGRAVEMVAGKEGRCASLKYRWQ